jgi:hygromycin-B 4-O-kinase
VRRRFVSPIALSSEPGVPSYKTLSIHELENENDFAYQIIEKLPGTAVVKWLETHPQDELDLLKQCGRTMSKIHQIKVEGFGPFDNEKAKNNKLIGLHSSYINALQAGLTFNLDVLTRKNIFTSKQVTGINDLFSNSNKLLHCDNPVLIHNDFADWNLLTDGKNITGVLDWDECVGGDYISDIACWSTFFEPERLNGMLEGYFENKEKPKDFDEKLKLLIFRYVISKMTLRIRRYTWEPSESIKIKIERGKNHLANSLKYFGI